MTFIQAITKLNILYSGKMPIFRWQKTGFQTNEEMTIRSCERARTQYVIGRNVAIEPDEIDDLQKYFQK